MLCDARAAVRCLGLVLLVGGSAACRSGDHPRPQIPPQTDGPPGTSQPGPAPGTPVVPGTPVSLTISEAERGDRARVAGLLGQVSAFGPTELSARYPTAFVDTLTYDPLKALNLDLIQSSPQALDAAETAILKTRGFVISDRQRFPAFPYGYEAIYAAHLPVFISADAILHAVHRSYDEILKQLETVSLRDELDRMLTAMRGQLGQNGGDAQSRKDADLYLAVAISLLRDQTVMPVADADPMQVAALVGSAKAAAGSDVVTLFGVARTVDFSQFDPRGHYNDTPALQTYFRSMMWLGNVDLRLIETQPDHSQVFHRRQFDGMLVLAELLAGTALDSWKRIDGAIAMFVGESDNMTVGEVPGLLADLGAKTAADTRVISDTAIAQALVKGNYGAQRISSHIMINGLQTGTLPLSRTFLLLGQRYVLDSHVFSNVVYDRVQKGAQLRMMPDPLDAAFAALANNQAANLLRPQLDKYKYASDLAAMRVLSDDHGDTFWNANLYNVWLSSLRTLSSRPAQDSGPLEVTQTEAWGRRILNTQLASWAELRHDTILYAKQSYTAGIACEFPDALVEPSPAFFARLEVLAHRGTEVVMNLQIPTSAVSNAFGAYFIRLGEVAGLLREMAEFQRDGKPFTGTHMQFINQTVRVQRVCGGGQAQGWYADLFFNPSGAVKFDPTIADVHTEPIDEHMVEVGRVLHVGTGFARLMVVTANTCQGPRAYAGLASSYFEVVTEHYKRLDDQSWAKQLMEAPPTDVAWMTDVIGR
jgi:hypothetical protein